MFPKAPFPFSFLCYSNVQASIFTFSMTKMKAISCSLLHTLVLKLSAMPLTIFYISTNTPRAPKFLLSLLKALSNEIEPHLMNQKVLAALSFNQSKDSKPQSNRSLRSLHQQHMIPRTSGTFDSAMPLQLDYLRLNRLNRHSILLTASLASVRNSTSYPSMSSTQKLLKKVNSFIQISLGHLQHRRENQNMSLLFSMTSRTSAESKSFLIRILPPFARRSEHESENSRIKELKSNIFELTVMGNMKKILHLFSPLLALLIKQQLPILLNSMEKQNA